MKIQVMLILVICLFSCTTQPLAVKKWFPGDITNLSPIDEYINNFSADDINAARNGYLTLLAFIEEVIDASHENLRRAYTLDSPTVKRPAMINGTLTIIEDTDMTSAVFKWDEVRMERMEVALAHAPWEFIIIIEHSQLYNKLLDHWHSLTGELLGEHIDVETVYENLLQDHAPLLEPQCIEVF